MQFLQVWKILITLLGPRVLRREEQQKPRPRLQLFRTGHGEVLQGLTLHLKLGFRAYFDIFCTIRNGFGLRTHGCESHFLIEPYPQSGLVRMGQDQSGRVRTGQEGSGRVRTDYDWSGLRWTGQDWYGLVRKCQERSVRVRRGQDGSARVRMSQDGSGRIRTGQDGSGRLRTGQEWSGKVKKGQERSGKVRKRGSGQSSGWSGQSPGQ